MKTYGRLVGCGTGSTRSDGDRGVPLEGVHDFYGKRHLGETIRVTGQGVAGNGKISYCERRLLAMCHLSWHRQRVIASRASWAGLVTELLQRKDGDKAGYIEDTRTCVGMEVRVCTGGGGN